VAFSFKKLIHGVGRAVLEPSSWAGVAGIAQAVAHVLPQYAGLLGVITAVAGAIAVVKKESPGQDQAGASDGAAQ
jgi:hypothetical protein